MRAAIAATLLGFSVLISAFVDEPPEPQSISDNLSAQPVAQSAHHQSLRSRLASFGAALEELGITSGSGGSQLASVATMAGAPLLTAPTFEGRLLDASPEPSEREIQTLLVRAERQAEWWREATDALEERRQRIESIPSLFPTRGSVSSGFSANRLHPILERIRAHRGVDISARPGSPIIAAGRGTVVFAGRNGDFGLMVEVDHGNGYVTRYAHAARLLVRVGDKVERGQEIGKVGQTGLATSPHLHYEVLVNGRQSNPRRFLYGPSPGP